MAKSCTSLVTHSKVKIEEHKRKAVFLNKKQSTFSVTKIDDCVVKTGLRTDYLVSNEDGLSVLVELKGRDVEHACSQLFASLKDHRVKPLLNKKVGMLVVCSKFPRFDTFVAEAKQRYAREYKSGFHVVCGEGEFDMARVVAIDGPF